VGGPQPHPRHSGHYGEAYRSTGAQSTGSIIIELLYLGQPDWMITELLPTTQVACIVMCPNCHIDIAS
jgi:hypothetical protein